MDSIATPQKWCAHFGRRTASEPHTHGSSAILLEPNISCCTEAIPCSLASPYSPLFLLRFSPLPSPLPRTRVPRRLQKNLLPWPRPIPSRKDR